MTLSTVMIIMIIAALALGCTFEAFEHASLKRQYPVLMAGSRSHVGVYLFSMLAVLHAAIVLNYFNLLVL